MLVYTCCVSIEFFTFYLGKLNDILSPPPLILGPAVPLPSLDRRLWACVHIQILFALIPSIHNPYFLFGWHSPEYTGTSQPTCKAQYHQYPHHYPKYLLLYLTNTGSSYIHIPAVPTTSFHPVPPSDLMGDSSFLGLYILECDGLGFTCPLCTRDLLWCPGGCYIWILGLQFWEIH